MEQNDCPISHSTSAQNPTNESLANAESGQRKGEGGQTSDIGDQREGNQSGGEAGGQPDAQTGGPQAGQRPDPVRHPPAGVPHLCRGRLGPG
jgi:hypothetical protein